jgi:hypothetical protein
MAENFGGMNRLIRVLEEEHVELESAGMFDEADHLMQRIITYRDMRARAHKVAADLNND